VLNLNKIGGTHIKRLFDFLLLSIDTHSTFIIAGSLIKNLEELEEVI
jgi:hypothetical protein